MNVAGEPEIAGLALMAGPNRILTQRGNTPSLFDTPFFDRVAKDRDDPDTLNPIEAVLKGAPILSTSALGLFLLNQDLQDPDGPITHRTGLSDEGRGRSSPEGSLAERRREKSRRFWAFLYALLNELQARWDMAFELVLQAKTIITTQIETLNNDIATLSEITRLQDRLGQNFSDHADPQSALNAARRKRDLFTAFRDDSLRRAEDKLRRKDRMSWTTLRETQTDVFNFMDSHLEEWKKDESLARLRAQQAKEAAEAERRAHAYRKQIEELERATRIAKQNMLREIARARDLRGMDITGSNTATNAGSKKKQKASNDAGEENAKPTAKPPEKKTKESNERKDKGEDEQDSESPPAPSRDK